MRARRPADALLEDEEWLRPSRRSYRGVALAAGAVALVIATWAAARWTLAGHSELARAQRVMEPTAQAHPPATRDPAAGSPEPTDGAADSATGAAGQRPPARVEDRLSSRRARRDRRRSRTRTASSRSRVAAADKTERGVRVAAEQPERAGRDPSRTAVEEAQAAALALADGAASERAAGASSSARPDALSGTRTTVASDAEHPEPTTTAAAAGPDARGDTAGVPDADTGARAAPDAEQTAPAGAADAADGGRARTAVAQPRASADGQDGQDGASARAGFFVKLGRAQLAQGRAAEAEISFARALGLQPGNAEARAGLADARSHIVSAGTR